ncbi:hypothetical protein EVAR_30682_1 [Eumeta japonica]|uniref:Uncharacterized protein n=1 Tax=Eumeta variegata TaxID=151549 RepID=A0A4C1VTT7_EUMVA|nr:hypothetical protein EVAR_30682_1 [Eumeta japonica]
MDAKEAVAAYDKAVEATPKCEWAKCFSQSWFTAIAPSHLSGGSSEVPLYLPGLVYSNLDSVVPRSVVCHRRCEVNSAGLLLRSAVVVLAISDGAAVALWLRESLPNLTLQSLILIMDEMTNGFPTSANSSRALRRMPIDSE